jgi:hypothetical protein
MDFNSVFLIFFGLLYSFNPFTVMGGTVPPHKGVCYALSME